MARRSNSAPPGPPEFALAVACCRRPDSRGRAAEVREAAVGIDWTLLVRVARRHRVEGLVWEALRGAEVDVPEEAGTALSAAARQIATRNLKAAAESARLSAALAAAEVEALFVKGLTLGALAYGRPTLKMGWDIDLWVRPERVEAAAQVLERLGYALAIPGPAEGRSRLGAWHRRFKESLWHDPARDSYVELHSALVDNERLLGGVVFPDVPRPVEVAKGIVLPTLDEDDLFAYLCVHGASSAWFRLKWLADLAALLAGAGEAEIERLYRRSQELGAGRAAGQALLLARRLFATAVGDDLGRRLERVRAHRWLERRALAMMAGRTVSTELAARRLATLDIHLTQLALLPGWRFKLGEARRQLAGILLRGA